MTALVRHGSWSQTFTGRQFWPFDPRPEDIEVEDIAHALSMLCRFGGHCRVLYTVGEHCVRASFLVPEEDALWALLHDASEAYLIDLPRPIKRDPSFAPYREVEARLMAVICERFGLPDEMPKSVKMADEVMLATEARDLMGPAPADWHLAEKPLESTIVPWQPWEAKSRFLTRFRWLTRGVL